METAEPKRSKRAEPLEQRPSGTAEISCGSPSHWEWEARLLEGGGGSKEARAQSFYSPALVHRPSANSTPGTRLSNLPDSHDATAIWDV